MTNLLLSAAADAAVGSIHLRSLSLGAGVQSTTVALMAAHGEIGPLPDCAIFADTGWEPQAVYDHFAWLMSPNVASSACGATSAKACVGCRCIGPRR